MTPGATIRAGLLATAVVALGLPAAALAQGGGTSTEAGKHQPSPAQAAQQERMRNCNAEAGKRSLAADARRSFMKECLAGRMPPAAAADQPSPAQAAQQDRMRSCNAEAGTRSITGDARRAFMSDCLAGRTATGAGAAPSPAQSGAPRR